MQKRSALLVGSLPFKDEETSMREALTLLGSQLFSLPDGEIGEKSDQFPKGDRIAWVIFAIEKLTADRTSWQIVKDAVRGEDGMAVDYDTIQKLKPLRPPDEMHRFVRFGYDDYFQKSYPIFKKQRQKHGLKDLRFQVGLPTGFAMGFAFASKLDWIRYTYSFNTVLAREINNVLSEAGDDVIIQLEVPPELYAAYQLPAPLMGLSLKPIQDILSKINPGAHIGIHICLGDFHNEALIHPKTLDKMVGFSNRLMESWPGDHKLEYIHYPFSEGAIPPRTDASYYAPLKDIQMDKDTRFIAGFVHEDLSLQENKQILTAIETARGTSVDIASSCGLGRRTPEQARQVMKLTSQLVGS